jgi:hypothetical protein
LIWDADFKAALTPLTSTDNQVLKFMYSIKEGTKSVFMVPMDGLTSTARLAAQLDYLTPWKHNAKDKPLMPGEEWAESQPKARAT